MANSGAQFALDDEAWPGGAWGTGVRPDQTPGLHAHEGPIFRRLGMPNRPGNDDRNAVTGQRDTSNDSARQNGSQNGGSAAARTRSNRGFASMDRDKQKEIASKGG